MYSQKNCIRDDEEKMKSGHVLKNVSIVVTLRLNKMSDRKGSVLPRELKFFVWLVDLLTGNFPQPNPTTIWFA
jgi:hypothetical protein